VCVCVCVYVCVCVCVSVCVCAAVWVPVDMSCVICVNVRSYGDLNAYIPGHKINLGWEQPTFQEM